jgi:GNAT superfamily N-acetyltransferase
MSLLERPANVVDFIGGRDSSPAADASVPGIRCLGGQHELELRRLFLSLEPAARCYRFGLAASDAYLTKYAKDALGNATSILGAFPDDRLRGVVEIHGEGPQAFAEAAFVVEPQWRRRGLGWALLRAAIEVASEAQANSLRMIFCRHNWPMRKLASKANGRLDVVLDELSVDVALGGLGQPIAEAAE